MDFKNLCTLFEEVKRKGRPKDKQNFLRDHFNKIRNEGKRDPNFDFFQILRLFVPSMDRERDTYNMKEARVARVLIRLLALPPGDDKNVLSRSHLMAVQAADFGDVVYSVIRKYLRSYTEMVTVVDINKFLDDLTKRKNESEAEELMMKMFEKLPAENIRWVIRIILKEMKLGITPNMILNAYHKDAAAYYATNNSLKKVCEVLVDETVKLNELEIEIFEPFRPMLSKRIDASNFKKEFSENVMYYIENKFDGERFQLHMKNGEFRYFSRNGFNFTDNLGKDYESGIFTPRLKGVFDPNINKLILDGELMLWDRRTRCYGCKGLPLDVKKLNDTGPFQPCFCVFDIIMVNDKVLTNVVLEKRLEILEAAFEYKEGTIMCSEVKKVSSRKEIVDELNAAVQREDEGTIVKHPESVYRYGDRNSGWYKMKLEYFQDSMNDLDLIVMGGKFASSTCDTLNSFIVGVRSDKTSDGRPIYRSLGKVTSGLRKEQLESMDDRLKTRGKKYDQFDSDVLVFGKETPDYYIEPEHSIIFHVRATELIRNTDNSYAASYTLRFPRILSLRYDKPVDECLTLNELLDLTKTNKAVIKLARGTVDIEELLKVKVRKRTRARLQMMDVYDTKKESDLLKDYTIYVLNGSEQIKKEEAESLVKKAGGKVVYRAWEYVDIILVGKPNDHMKQLVARRDRYDIIDLKWLQRILQAGNVQPYEHDDVHYVGWNYRNVLTANVDMYGDSYTEETNVEKLKRTFEIIKNMGESCSDYSTMHYTGFKNYRLYRAYFDKYAIPNNSSSEKIYDSTVDEAEFKFYYGTVYEKICDEVNLIIFENDDERKKYMEEYLKGINRVDIQLKSKAFLYE